MKIKISYEFQLFFYIVIFIAVLVGLSSCEKQEPFEPIPKPIYKICNVKIDSIVVWPNTALDGKYMNIRIQHHVLDRYGNWVWCDVHYEEGEEPKIYWGDHRAQFNFEISEPDMAIEIKPATCVTGGTSVILGFRMSINDSIVRFSRESKFIRIKINN